ncbi:MAG: hypothetical protein MRECE_6c020 [Mycoplasmataceae bacterium CE_OT135]|nr:MAG: hypothetical protein MRECE_17c030 [Mycoplasmataceae bacterium CE_OT135]KLL03924.1 MAG: hypothetical protein MRECE_6c020 [Mycoplasmataceae bacterium CE_OT135]
MKKIFKWLVGILLLVGLVGGGYLVYRSLTKPSPQQIEQNEKNKEQIRRQIQLIKEETTTLRIKFEKAKNGEDIEWKTIDEFPRIPESTHPDPEEKKLRDEIIRVWNEYCQLLNEEVKLWVDEHGQKGDQKNDKIKKLWERQKNGQWEILTNPLDKDPKVKEQFNKLIQTFYQRAIEKKGLYYPEVDFRGFGHFYITEANLLKKTVEMGHTGPPRGEEAIDYINRKITNYPMEINLNQIYLLNNGKIGMDELIVDFTEFPPESKQSPIYTPIDISFDKLIETIAHELAHAVQNVLNLYDAVLVDSEQGKKTEIRSQCESSGYRNDKNELLYPQWAAEHTRLTKEIQQMIINSPEYKEFEAWWKSA